MGVCGLNTSRDLDLPHLITTDEKGTLINWRMPLSKNPELKYVEIIKSPHGTVDGGIDGVHFVAPKYLMTKDNDGNKVRWTFSKEGKLIKENIANFKMIKKVISIAFYIVDFENIWIFTGTVNGMIIQWKFHEKAIFKIWQKVVVCSITSLIWNDDTKSLLIGDSCGN